MAGVDAGAGDATVTPVGPVESESCEMLRDVQPPSATAITTTVTLTSPGRREPDVSFELLNSTIPPGFPDKK